MILKYFWTNHLEMMTQLEPTSVYNKRTRICERNTKSLHETHNLLNRHCLRRSVTNKPITLWSCIRNCWAAEQTSQLGSFLEPIFAVINFKVSRGT